MRFPLESTSRKSQLNRAIKPVLESLENRQMLTIVEGGQTAYYQNSAGQVVKVVVDGGGSLAFVGSSRNAFGQAQLNDVPMTILDSTTGAVIRESLGGVGGRDGIAPITEITNLPTDSRMRATSNGGLNSFYNFGGPTDAIAFEALGTNSLGRTYAVNRRIEGFGAADDNPAYDVVGVNNSNGRVEVLDSIAGKVLSALQAENGEVKIEDLGDLIGADFDPSNPDMLYIAMQVNYPFANGTTFTRKDVPVFLSYNIRSEAVTFINRFGANSDTDDFAINDFTFLDGDRIAFFGSVKRGDNDANEGLFITEKTRPGPDNFSPIEIGIGDDAEEITEVAAIEAIDSTFILAVDARSDSGRILRINLDGDDVDGTIVAGTTLDPDVPEDADPKRGADIADLAFNPTLVDQSTFQAGKKGVLLGADTSTDELVGLDVRERFPSTDVYAVYSTEATSDTSLSMTILTPSTREELSFEQQLFQGVSNPYASSAGAIGTLMVDPGQDAPVAITLNNGGVFIGGRSLDADDRPIIPEYGLSSARDGSGDYVGTLPGVKLPAIVNPGIYISGSINDILIAGTITGRVSIDGSVDTFYAGNIVTGDAWTGSNNLTVDNFFVGGDLRNLQVAGAVGKLAGSPGAFDPVSDFAIGGRVQQIRTGGEFRATIDVAGKVNGLTNRDLVFEIETVVNPAGNNVANAFDNFTIANQGNNRNDSFDTPQIIGSIADSRGRGGQVSIIGTVNNGPNFGDVQDTYGLPVIAGEGAVIQLLNFTTNLVQLQVFDPSGRLYYTNQSNQNGTREDRLELDDSLSYSQPINITADKPGLWRVRVIATTPEQLVNLDRLYQLNFTQIGALTVGGIASNGNLVLSNFNQGIKVRTGDIGAILAVGELYGAELGVPGNVLTGRESTITTGILALNGSIRAIEAGNISHLENGVLSGYPNIVASGKIGSIHSDDRLYINRAGLAVNVGTSGLPSKNFITGGDIQLVEAGGNFSGVLATNGSIGVIRAGSIDANTLGISRASYFQVNADGKGNDELGLIDSVGDFGNFDEGGPSLRAGNGANIRYIRVGGNIYRDRFFGFGTTIVDTATNDSITVTDDSGAEVSVKPITGDFNESEDTTGGGNGTDTTGNGTGTDTLTNGLPDPFGGSGGTGNNGSGSFPDPFNGGGTGGLGGFPDPFGETPVITDPTDPDAGVPDQNEVFGQLRLETYPVRSGGFVITSVESTTGVSVATNREGGGGTADISRIQTGVNGTPLVEDEDGNLVGELGTEENPNFLLDVILVGNSRINVFVIEGSATGATGATYSRIDNFTDGEIVNVNAQSIGVLTGEWLGVSRPVSTMRMEGVNNAADARFNGVANTYPFNNAKNMIFVTNAGTIGARGPMGNITIKERVQNLIANAGNKNVKGVLEGIVAPVLVLTGDDATAGIIDRIDIGEGLAFSGTGRTSFGGIYSTDEIGTISNINGSGDLRGDVVARTYIDKINVTGGGSIIESDIYVFETGADGRSPIPGPTGDTTFGFEAAMETINILPDVGVVNDSPTNPYGLGKITISGKGGMMNTRVYGYNIGKLTANRGSFGIFSSDFIAETGGSMGGISADGLGIRFVTYRGGSFMGDVIATGKGAVSSIDDYTRSLRQSENGAFDGSTGLALTIFNDLSLFLETDDENRSIPGVTTEGIIEDCLIQSNRTIRSVQAFTIRARFNPFEARPRDETYPMQINTGGELKLVNTIRSIEGLRVVSGTTGNIQSGYDIKNFQLQTTGFVNLVSAKRNILGSSNLNLIGSASINQILVGGNMNGTAYVAKGIRSLVVGGNLSSQKSQGGIYTAASINLVDIGGNVTSGTYLQAKNVIKSLIIDGDIQSGAEVLAKSIGSKNIKGDVDGVLS